jgi:hypothetical protein
MPLFGLPAGFLAGALNGVACYAIVALCNEVFGASIYGLLAVWVLPAFVSAGSGALAGYIVGKANIIGKGRNITATATFGVLSGLVGCVGYVFLRIQFFQEEAFDHSIDFIRTGINCIAMIIGAFGVAGSSAGNNPFCEKCKEFMKKTLTRKLPLDKEENLMDMLNRNDYSEIKKLQNSKITEDGNKVEVEAWHCETCHEAGFLNATTTKSKYKTDRHGTKTTDKTESRLIFSTALRKENVGKLTGVSIKKT